MAGSVVNVRWSNEFMSKLDEIKRELAGKLTEALERAEAAEATLDKVYVLTTRELAEPCGKETDTLIKIASAIEAIRYPQQTPEDDGFRKCCPSCGVKYTVDITITQLRERAEAAETRLAERDAEVAALQAALQAANEDAARLADKLSEVVAYGGYYADIENRMPPDGQTFKVIAVSPSGVDDFTVLRMDGKLYFASDPPREVPNGFEIIRIKPWDVKTFGKTEEEDF